MISYRSVMYLHQRLVSLGLCVNGVRDTNLLISAVNGQGWYRDVFSQYVHVAYSINAGHVFADGNKRTCFLVLKELNKYRYYFDDRLLADAILNLAKGGVSRQEFFNSVKRLLL